MSNQPMDDAAIARQDRDHAHPIVGRRLRVGLQFFLVIVASCLLVLAYLAYRGVTVSLQAENTLHTYGLVLEVVTNYVETNERWPDSWNDLLTSSPSNHASRFQWPDDVEQIAEVVSIDFALTIDAVARMTENQFMAVKQIGPNYGPEHHEIGRLLAAARKAAKQSAKD